MKTLTILTIFFISFNCFSQCPNSDIVLSSQNDIDNFSTNYPNCTQLNNSLKIEGTNATNLSPLSSITSVNNSVFIKDNVGLTSLTGLSNLATIGSNFFLENNASLTDISALNGLTSIGLSFYLKDNGGLTSLTGLSSLATIGSNFFLENNASLTDITGLNALVTVSNNFYIQNNSNLTNCNIDYICNGSNSNITISNNNTGCNDITEACSALSIIDEEINTVKIYPNPTKGFINLISNNLLNVELYDMLGKKVLTTNNIKIDLSSFKTGIYLLKVKSRDNGSIETYRLIKE